MKIAFIDDSPSDRFIFQKYLSGFNIEIDTFKSSIDFGRHEVDETSYDYIFIDVHVNHGAGSDAIMKGLKDKVTARFVLISSSKDHLTKDYRDDKRIDRLMLKWNKARLQDWAKTRLMFEELEKV